MARSIETLGPRPRDELTTWSTARLSQAPLAAIPGYTAPPPPGRTMTVAGQDVFVRCTDSPESGPDTWYVHGLDGSSQNWDRLAAALSAYSRGFAPDLPGSGRSAPPRDGSYAITRQADLLAALIERQSAAPVHLVGNSRGGMVATFLAARHPGLIASMTLISPAVPDLRLIGERGADPRLALVMVPGTLKPAVRRLATLTPADRARGLALTCFGEPEALDAADLDAAAQDFALRAQRSWTLPATVKSLRSLIRAQLRPGRWSFAAAAAAVTVPVLVIWGTRDKLVDARLARGTVAAFANSRLLMLERTGHVAQMERPARVARAMLALWADVGAPEGDNDRGYGNLAR